MTHQKKIALGISIVILIAIGLFKLPGTVAHPIEIQGVPPQIEINRPGRQPSIDVMRVKAYIDASKALGKGVYAWGMCLSCQECSEISGDSDHKIYGCAKCKKRQLGADMVAEHEEKCTLVHANAKCNFCGAILSIGEMDAFNCGHCMSSNSGRNARLFYKFFIEKGIRTLSPKPDEKYNFPLVHPYEGTWHDPNK